MSDRRGPWYGCTNGDCSAEITYPKEELSVDQHDEVWCEGCLEGLHEHEHDELVLSRFVPESDKVIEVLQQLVEGIERAQLYEQVRLEEVVSSLRRTHPELVYPAEAEVYKAKQEAAQEKGNE
jgi:hypothetical protein